MHDFDSIYFAAFIQFSGHGARACSAGVGQQTGSRQAANWPIIRAATREVKLFSAGLAHGFIFGSSGAFQSDA